MTTYSKGTFTKRSAKDLSNDSYAMFLCCFFGGGGVSDFLYKAYVVGIGLHKSGYQVKKFLISR